MFKYLGFVFNETGIDEMECCMEVASARRATVAI